MGEVVECSTHPDDDGGLVDLIFTERTQDSEHAFGPVGLEVATADDAIAEEERQDVVPVPAPVGRDIDLDLVLEAEESFTPLPKPYDRIERRDEGAHVDRTGLHGTGMQECRSRPSLDGNLDQFLVLDQFVETCLGRSLRQAVVVDEIGRCTDPKAGRRPPQQLAMRFLLAGSRQCEDLRRNDPVEEIELLHEARPSADTDLADPEQPVECNRTFRSTPPPLTVTRPRVLEFSGSQAAALTHLGQHLVDVRRIVGGIGNQLPPRLTATRSLLVPAQQRLGFDREQARLVAPRLEPLAVPVGDAVEKAGVVGAEPRERRHVLGAHHNRNRVELQEAKPTHDPPEVAAIDCSGGLGVAEPLGTEGDSTGCRSRECGQSAHARSTARVGAGCHPYTHPMPKRFAGWRVLALATIVMGLTGPGQTIGISVFIDHFADSLGLTKNQISAGYAIGTLCGSLTLPTVGQLIDRYGVRRAMVTIASLFALGLVFMSGVQSLVMLTIGFFFIRMLGQGSLSLVSTVAISLWFDRRRGFALGIAMTISSSIMALVPVALSFAIDRVGWRDAWVAAAATIAVVVIPISWFGIIDRPSTIGQLPDGAPVPETDDHPVTEEWGVERNEALRSRAFWILALATSLTSMLSTALNFHQIALLGESGFSETAAAVMFLPQVIGALVGSPGMGIVIDRVGTRYAPAATLVGLSATLLLAGTVTSTVGVIAYATWFGFQAGTVRTLGAALIPTWFGTRHLGSIQGSMTFLGVLASAAGPIAFSLTETASGSFRQSATLWMMAPLIAAAFALSKRPVPDHVP